MKDIIKKASTERIFIYNANNKVHAIRKFMKENKWVQLKDAKEDEINIYEFITNKELLKDSRIRIFFSNKRINNFHGDVYDMNDLINDNIEIPENFETCDEKIYYKIIPQKEKMIRKIENILKKIAIDYHLYKELSKTPSKDSTVKLNSSDDVLFKTVKIPGIKIPTIKNTCPVLRRPVNDKCPPGNIMKVNKQGIKCCYIDRKKKI
jgi:hypothetical protein